MVSNFIDELLHCQKNDRIDASRYRAMIGVLLFLSRKSRPNITTAEGDLVQFGNSPTILLTNCDKRVFEYLKLISILEINFKFCKKRNRCLSFYADSEIAGDKSGHISFSGPVGFFNGMLFHSKSRKQKCVSLSSADAEYVLTSGCASDMNGYSTTWTKQNRFLNYR